MNVRGRLRSQARRLKRELTALSLAVRHPGTPWYAKAVGIAVVAYALSPLDLIPDVIPVLGYLDDVILVPIGIAVTLRLIPTDVMEECRALVNNGAPTPRGRYAPVIIVWVLLVGWAGIALWLHLAG